MRGRERREWKGEEGKEKKGNGVGIKSELSEGKKTEERGRGGKKGKKSIKKK